MATNNSINAQNAQYNLIVGTGNAYTNIAPSVTSGVPLISQGASANPTYGTAVVAGGGTGVTSNTSYAVLCGGTTSTNPVQSIASVGTAGQVLTSNGAGALPTFQSPIAFSAYLNANLTNVTGNSVAYTVKYDTTSFDTNSAYNTTTGKYKAPKTGKYLFFANVLMSNVIIGNDGMRIQITTDGSNGSLNFNCNPYTASSFNFFGAQGTVIMQLNANDEVYVLLTVYNGTQTIGLFTDGKTSTNVFQGYYIGP